MDESPTILIIDDDLGDREAIASALMLQDYHLVFAENGPEGLQKAAEVTPDVVLLDLGMYPMDGIEVCQKMRSDPLLAEVPVLMVTGFKDRDMRLKVIEAGADDFITKPFDRVELRARVGSITRLNRYRRLLLERIRFAWVMEQSNDGYLILKDNGHVLYANPKARIMLHMPTDETQPVSGTFQQWAQKVYRCEPEDKWDNWLETLRSNEVLYMIHPEDDTSHDVWMNVELLNVSWSKDTGLLVRISDISEQLELQREVWSFHAIIAHKLRTPLSNMILGMELLTSKADKLSMEHVTEWSRALLQNAQLLRGEIDEILRFLNVSRLNPANTPMVLSELAGMVAQVTGELGMKAVNLLLPDEMSQIRLSISQRAMELVLWQVLENSQKFHPDLNPQVEMFISQIDTDRIRLRVRDDGVNLPPQNLSRVWFPYFQGGKDFTGETPGMGLGLPLIASLVWSVGGKYRMMNRSDRPGVVMELILPVLQAQQEK